MKVALLLLAASVNLLPPVMVQLVGGKLPAWEYAAYGFEAAFLWAFAVVVLAYWRAPVYQRMGAMCVASWGFIEALQRPVCRLMLPMDRSPKLEPTQRLCDVALGFNVSAISLVVVGGLIALLAHEYRNDRKH